MKPDDQNLLLHMAQKIGRGSKLPPTDFPQECALKTTSFFEVPPEIERAGGNCMRFIRAVERFFEGLRDGMAAQREIEGRTNEGSVFEPMTELFRWIAVIVILAIVVSVPLWVGITVIRWMWNHPLW